MTQHNLPASGRILSLLGYNKSADERKADSNAVLFISLLVLVATSIPITIVLLYAGGRWGIRGALAVFAFSIGVSWLGSYSLSIKTHLNSGDEPQKKTREVFNKACENSSVNPDLIDIKEIEIDAFHASTYAAGKTIKLSKRLAHEFSTAELQGVIYHELGHILEEYSQVKSELIGRLVLLIGIICALFIGFSTVQGASVLFLFAGGKGVASNLYQYRAETQADARIPAGSTLGFSLALSRIANDERMVLDSGKYVPELVVAALTGYPSIASRINSTSELQQISFFDGPSISPKSVLSFSIIIVTGWALVVSTLFSVIGTGTLAILGVSYLVSIFLLDQTTPTHIRSLLVFTLAVFIQAGVIAIGLLAFSGAPIHTVTTLVVGRFMLGFSIMVILLSIIPALVILKWRLS